MIYTNLMKLPEPIVRLVENPTYHEERSRLLTAFLNFKGLPHDTPHYSVSDLIRAPRQVVLIRRYGAKVVRDVSDGMWAMLGSMLHEALHRGAKLVNEAGGTLVAEKRLFAVVPTNSGRAVVSGEPDLIDAEGNISDYKLTGVYAFQKGKIEWEHQLNAYAWLRRLNDETAKALSITAFLRDWMKSETVKEGYPPSQCATVGIDLWPMQAVNDWIHARLEALMEADKLPDDRLPECTSEEMWERPETWAVIKKGGARATKVFKIPGNEGNLAATADAERRGPEFSVEHRPGERIKCSRGYCDAASFCNVYKEYAAAAWGKMPVKEGDK